MPDRSLKLSVFASLIFLTLVAALLVYHGITRYQQYHEFQQTNAQTMARGIATEVGLFISDKRRMVRLFANEHINTISQTVSDEEKIEKNIDYLKKRARLFFPDYFALTVLDQALQPVIDDFDGLIGDLCLQDSQKILTSNKYQVRIHPNPIAYHFDIVSPWKTSGKEGIFFISFHSDFLGRLLKGRQIPGHQLLLVDKTANNLIEVTPDGARVNWIREDYRLQEDELTRILVEIPVKNTRWYVYTLHDADLFSNEINKIVIESLSIFFVFSLMTGIWIWLLQREASRRLRAEQVKNEFISLINHELRTPLTAIRGGLGLIANGVTNEIQGKTAEIAQLALNNAEHLGQLVDDLLDVQKLTAGKLEIHKEKIRILPLVEHVLKNYKSYADRFGATFNLLSNSDDSVILADPHRIEQVLANLLSNAAKYGKEQDEIEVLLKKDTNKIRISITDHGQGIPIDFQTRLFKAFEQSGDKREHVVRGTGLGLYIAKAIIQEHDGDIGFVTKQGQGSCFWFELPTCDTTP